MKERLGQDSTEVLNGEVVVEPATKTIKGEVKEMTNAAPNGVPKEPIECDVLVVGAGFSGITAIDRFRKAGMVVKCFESGTDFGGVWYWNRYPGARVDSELPFYQLNIPEVWRNWSFTERFPDHHELRRYMAHINKVLNLDRDVYFSARVNDCTWDEKDHKWTVKTLQGHCATAKYLISCSGLLHRTYTPDFPGLEDYKGKIYHSGAWPEDFDAKGKRVAVIGAGATAVQITQELGKQADEMTVFLRRPSYCIAMKQRKWPAEDQHALKAYYKTLFEAGRSSGTGFPNQPRFQSVLEVSPEEREQHWEECWERGGFNFSLQNFWDSSGNPESNKLVYDFWRKKVCARLTDPAKHKIMAPEKQPYYFGTKRSPLEQDYYEVLNQPNVHIHSLKASPLKTFTPTGLTTSDGTEHTFDAIALATGFDSYTGSLTQMGLKSKTGESLADLWREGVSTYLGITVAGFPNFFMSYTPQSPTALSNGPTIIEAQVETIVDMIKKLESERVVAIDAKKDAAEEWKGMLGEMVKHTLFPFTDSWWNGANIPGKKAENMLYVGGINVYEKQVRATMDGWKGFDITLESS